MATFDPGPNYYDNYVLAIDVGFRSTGLALFDVTKTGLELVHVACVSPKKKKKTKDDYVSVMDVNQVMEMAKGVGSFISEKYIRRIVVELPSGGAKSSRAVRLMGMASAMIATLVPLMALQVEWYTPREIKEAAVDKPSAEKDEIMDAMGKLFPVIKSIPKVRREHIADACACMLAAQDGIMVKEIREGL